MGQSTGEKEIDIAKEVCGSATPRSLSPSSPRAGETCEQLGPADETAVPSQADPHHDVEAQVPPRSRTPSPPRPPVKVRRSQRRGLLGRLTLLAEVDEPRRYARSKKWCITAVIAMLAFAAPTGSAILFPSLADIAQTLDSTPAIANLSVALYMLALGVFPLFWSSFSETSGRRSVYVVSFALALVFNVMSALAINIPMFLVARVLSGGAAASVQVVGAGTIADVWESYERATAMGWFYLGPLMGPMLAPTIGGGLQTHFGWRGNMWFLVIYNFMALILLVFCLPETLKRTRPLILPFSEVANNEKTGDVLSRTATIRSAKHHSKRFVWLVHRTCIEPFGVLKLLRFPAVACACFYASATFFSLYLLNIATEVTFQAAPYHFTPIQVGLTYLAASSGYTVASVFGGRWTDWVMKDTARRKGRRDADGALVVRPEDRVRENAWVAALTYPLSLLWFGWATARHAHWAVPLVANFFFGLGAMLIFGMITTMLTEFMPQRASAGMSVNNFLRNALSCVGVVVAQPLLDAIGTGWLFTGLSVLTLASGALVWALTHWGPRWREAMDRELKN